MRRLQLPAVPEGSAPIVQVVCLEGPDLEVDAVGANRFVDDPARPCGLEPESAVVRGSPKRTTKGHPAASAPASIAFISAVPMPCRWWDGDTESGAIPRASVPARRPRAAIT